MVDVAVVLFTLALAIRPTTAWSNGPSKADLKTELAECQAEITTLEFYQPDSLLLASPIKFSTLAQLKIII